jgi:hypothetical protein
MTQISDAEYLGDYRLRFLFDNGREGVADLHSMVVDDHRPIFAPLRDAAVFQQLFVEHGAVCWRGDLDVAPEYIYYLVFRDDESLHGLFEEWGYIESEVAV